MFINRHHVNLSHNDCAHDIACVVATRAYNTLHLLNTANLPQFTDIENLNINGVLRASFSWEPHCSTPPYPTHGRPHLTRIYSAE